MTAADLPLIAFAACNTLRIAAYFPQMFKLARHPAAAASFSHSTWALFAAANLSTAVYAGVVLGDTVLGIVNAFSALCCTTLIGLAFLALPMSGDAVYPRASAGQRASVGEKRRPHWLCSKCNDGQL